MSFSAATCLTTTPQNVTSFDIFLGQNDYSTIFDTVAVSDITSPNCPYIVENIPDGTTYLSFKDSSGVYCFSIPVSDNDICLNCNLGFTNYSASTPIKLYCGILTGTCENPITDYKINWYGPDDTTTLAFTSGIGDTFDYTYTHPFSSTTTSIGVYSGVYTPVIEKIIVSGLTFSSSGDKGIYFSGNCLPTTNVLPMYCDVDTNINPLNPYSAYTNFVSFDSNIQGTPQPMSMTLKVSATTKYIVWSFNTGSKPDAITIRFSGSSISVGLEDFILGSDLGVWDLNLNTFPKSASSASNLTKFTCLTGFTVNDNDNILIDITPSETNTQWSLYVSCLNDYNCNDCLSTQNYKILSSSISGTTGVCDTVIVNFTISGCTGRDSNSDFVSYYTMPNFWGSTFQSLSQNGLIPRSTYENERYLSFFSNSCGRVNKFNTSSCETDVLSATTYSKTFSNGVGVWGLSGSSNFISSYYQSLTNSFSGLSSYSSWTTGSTNSNDLSYYRYYFMRIPGPIDPANCGDGRFEQVIYLHHTSPFISGVTAGGVYYLNITANTITKNISISNCSLNCNNYIDEIINQINTSSTGTTGYSGRTLSNSGVYYNNSIFELRYVVSASTTVTASTQIDGYFDTPDWSFNTYPFSGNPKTIIPSLSGTVCDYNNNGVLYGFYNSTFTRNFKYIYQVRLSNPSNINDFDIWASPITNFEYSGAPGPVQYELAYRFSGGSTTYTNSTYII